MPATGQRPDVDVVTSHAAVKGNVGDTGNEPHAGRRPVREAHVPTGGRRRSCSQAPRAQKLGPASPPSARPLAASPGRQRARTRALARQFGAPERVGARA